MKKCSVSLLSKAKILISVILALTVVCTMAVTISAANANEGYATANATVDIRSELRQFHEEVCRTDEIRFLQHGQISSSI